MTTNDPNATIPYIVHNGPLGLSLSFSDVVQVFDNLSRFTIHIIIFNLISNTKMPVCTQALA